MSALAHRLRTATFAAILILPLGGVSCSSSSDDPEWRRAREETIAVVVLKDLTELPPDGHAPEFMPTTFCASIGESWSGKDDPPPSVLAALRQQGIRVFPASECSYPDYRLKVDGSAAALIGVSSIEKKRRDQVKVKAGRLIGPLAGKGWVYTLSLTSRGWLIDNAKNDWIA